MNEFDYFDSARIISLPERRDRRADMTRELRRIGQVPGRDRVSFFDAVRPDDAGAFTQIGIRGCFLSHLEVLKEAQRLGQNNVLVLEDDLQLAPHVIEQMPKLIAQLRLMDWDICYFGHGETVPSGREIGWERWEKRVVCAHFYAVNGPTIQPLIQFLEVVMNREPGHPLGGPMHYDGAISTFRQQNPDVTTVIANPSQGGQRPSRSDITPSKMDQIPGMGHLINLARRMKRAIS